MPFFVPPKAKHIDSDLPGDFLGHTTPIAAMVLAKRSAVHVDAHAELPALCLPSTFAASAREYNVPASVGLRDAKGARLGIMNVRPFLYHAFNGGRVDLPVCAWQQQHL